MSLLHEDDAALVTCSCDAPLRATTHHPRPFHRPDCAAMSCRACGQSRVSHTFDIDGLLVCPDGRGFE